MIVCQARIVIKSVSRAMICLLSGCLMMLGACNAAPDLSATGSGQATNVEGTGADTTLVSGEDVIGGADAGSDDGDLSLIAKADSSMDGLWQMEVESKRRETLSDFQYEWDFGTGEIFSGMMQRRVFSSAGMYTITVRVLDRNGNLVAMLTLELEITAPGEPPIADAGLNQITLEGDIVLLDGSNSSDPADAPLLFQWTQIGGVPVTLINSDGTVASFSSPQVDEDETIQFKLAVSNGVSVVEDIVFVDILNRIDSVTNNLVASAGADLTVASGDTVTLDGSQSSSTVGALSYLWTQMSGATVTISGATNDIATFVAPNVTATDLLTFELIVSDGSQMAQDLINVMVNAVVTDNCPDDANKTEPGICGCGSVEMDVNGDGICDSPSPTVGDQNATTDQGVAKTLILTGSDADGDDLTFLIVSGPNSGSLGSVDNSATNSATVIYTPAAGFSGTDSFDFKANDGVSDSNTGTVTITVNAVTQALTLNFSTYFGGSSEDSIRDVFVDAAGYVYITGGTESSDFPTTAGAYDRTLGTAVGARIQDVFVAKLSPTGELVWSTLLGGPNYDRAYAIEVDQAGFVYVGGRAGANFPTTNGVLQPNFAGDVDPNSKYGGQDGFVTKLSPDGSSIVWSTYFGDDDRAFLRDIDIDSQGFVYVVLTALKRNNPHVTAGAFQTSHGGSRDGVIAKLSADATQVIWASYLGGSGNDVGTPSIRVDAAGQAHVLGFTSSPNIATTAGAYSSAFNGGIGDLHLAKFSADGSRLIYGTYLGGSDVEFTETHGLALDAAGNAYVAATTLSTNFPTTPGAFQRAFGGKGGSGTGSGTNYGGDGFIAKISADGSSLLASTYLGGRYGEGIEGVSVMANGDVFVAGTTFSDDFPTTLDAYQGSGGTKGDFFGALLASDLSSVKYVSYLGGSGDDYGRSATTDDNGFVYVVGHTKSTNWPKRNAAQSTLGGNWDGGIAKFAY